MSMSSETTFLTNSYYNFEEEDRFTKLIDTKEFNIINDNIKYDIIISKTKDKIFIRCNNYESKLNLDDYNKLNPLFCICKTIDDIYELLLNLFNHNKVLIKEVSKNNIIKLILIMYNNIHGIEENIEINLINSSKNKDSIINEMCMKYKTLQQDIVKVKSDYTLIYDNLSNLINDITSLKKENALLKEQIKLLEENQIQNKDAPPQITQNIITEEITIKNNNNNSPLKINLYADLTDDSYSHWGIDNTFTCFKTLDNKSYLAYSTEDFSILCYNLDESKMVKELKNPHRDNYITNFRHFVDKIHEKDILLTLSADNKNLKIWDIETWECLTDITNIYKNGYLYSACCLTEDNKNYIATCNSAQNSEPIFIFDFHGIKIKEINFSSDDTYFINIYHDEQLSKNYILTGNIGYVKSYDFKKNVVYHKYQDIGNRRGHDSIVIDTSNQIVKLIESCGDGYIRIWKFHTGMLISKICTGKNELRGICLWNNNYIYVGCVDNTIKLIDLQNEIVVRSLIGYNNEVCTIQKIDIPQYGGECIISQGWENDPIKIWTNKSPDL